MSTQKTDASVDVSSKGDVIYVTYSNDKAMLKECDFESINCSNRITSIMRPNRLFSLPNLLFTVFSGSKAAGS
jgi:hypothetical protein